MHSFQKGIRVVATVAVAFAANGCFDPEPECANNDGCEAGSVCIDQKCRQACSTLDDCPAGMRCQGGGYCETYTQSCSTSKDCDKGWYCNDDRLCAKQLGRGVACGSASDRCASGFCADGVCCNKACDSPCNACLGIETTGDSLNDGQCLPIELGTDPLDQECPGATVCNGEGACFAGSSGAACTQAYECTSGSCVDGFCCDGACGGICQACRGDWTGNANGHCAPIAAGADPQDECYSGYACNGSGACETGGLANGRACAEASLCATNFCVAGLCCESACSGTCEACDGALTGGEAGKCLPIPAGQDPRNECDGVRACDGARACYDESDGAICANDFECHSTHCVDGVCCSSVCDGTCEACASALTGGQNGVCANIKNGTDPENECGGSSVCQTGGTCAITCDDGTKNGSETDIDCGGGSCPKCNGNMRCIAASDCISGSCMGGGTCAGPAVTAIAGAGFARGFCVLLEGDAKCWGDNNGGRLGLGDTEGRGYRDGQMGGNLPYISLSANKRAVTAIAQAETRACAILDGGKVKCWGSNNFGMLGIGDPVFSNNRGDNDNEMGGNLPYVDIGAHTATALALGKFHNCAILENGQVKCWGCYVTGLGDTNCRGADSKDMGDNLPYVELGGQRTALAIASGLNHVCVILDNAAVKCWGENQYGQLGLGDVEFRGDNDNEMGDRLPSVELGTGRTAVAIACGCNHTCVILDDGKVKCWGQNGAGGLGLGDKDPRGDNDKEMGDYLHYAELGTGRTAVGIAAGVGHTCALLDDATLKCWGSNYAGALGLGISAPIYPPYYDMGDDPEEMGDNLPTVNLGSTVSVKAVSIVANSTCAILDNGRIKCWGNNDFGLLGLEDSRDRGENSIDMGDALPYVDLGGVFP